MRLWTRLRRDSSIIGQIPKCSQIKDKFHLVSWINLPFGKVSDCLPDSSPRQATSRASSANRRTWIFSNVAEKLDGPHDRSGKSARPRHPESAAQYAPFGQKIAEPTEIYPRTRPWCGRFRITPGVLLASPICAPSKPPQSGNEAGRDLATEFLIAAGSGALSRLNFHPFIFRLRPVKTPILCPSPVAAQQSERCCRADRLRKLPVGQRDIASAGWF